ncbi:anhydro-N-acetylmuramic acid kinase [Pseudidiomarina gelatinasegens]|jgi:anhydro-N-acetylmuramic acid kinase|uniref:Anhydro-N-acetylmuramic acid kinase n=1 Tax=Pseudidiomarina gelatinasegens TaxID=2487740 RepID=A0A443YY61_9GAMM|nr:anhydro-N-acetylmuramic acid kinase [Pseudidiomarina gelatinasegens]RWU09020.1 anhydro-N-acetylmuramic acid kinase [Pseudidiomarina gelatinasegens]
MSQRELYLGLMSGTSMDGLDVVLVEFDGEQPELLSHQHFPLPDNLQQQLHQLCQPGADELDLWGSADRLFGMFSAQCVTEFLRHINVSPNAIKAIGSHGQTVRHQPDAKPHYTLQLGDPNTIAALTGIPVVADFRRKDIALGGQGAPLVPAFHQAIFSSFDESRVILNLGGIANITWLPGTPAGVTGFDTGPANTLMDRWFKACHPEHSDEFDRHGAFAAKGAVLDDVLEKLVADSYFSRPPPKSTGRDDFNLEWLRSHVKNLDSYQPEDIQATLVALTAHTVADAISQWLPEPPETIFVAGGGAYNPILMSALKSALPHRGWHATSVLGVSPQHVEAMAFAWLARCYMQRTPGNLPAVTGASRPTVLGGLYLP